MSLISVTDGPPDAFFRVYESVKDLEKRSAVQMAGLLQATKSGHLILGVPTALVRGVYDAMSEPGISLPTSVDGGALRAGIVVMTPSELEAIGGPSKISERGKQYPYTLGDLAEVSARGWPGVTACWHLRVKSPELGKLRRSYGLSTKLEGDSDFSIVVACRKSGVLAQNATSKATSEEKSQKLPDWTLPSQ
jgi:hypothetical protein